VKKRIRRKLLKRRDAIPKELKALKESSIEKRLIALDMFKNAKSLLMYVSFRSEVDTTKFLQDVIRLGKRLILPVVDRENNSLILYEIKDMSELASGYMGILEPAVEESRRVTLRDIDLVVIPGTGFDIEGNRLGYGGGYYDRLLSYEAKQMSGVEHIPTVALAFEEQIGDEIPAEPHDIKVDVIVTDKRIIRCS
jgi:5-formyltetrahydrofolate cyclo-ligase